MLRLRWIEPITLDEPGPDGKPVKVLAVKFVGDLGDIGHCEFIFNMTDRGNDLDQLRDARAVLRDCVVALAHEMQTEGVPQSAPTDS